LQGEIDAGKTTLTKLVLFMSSSPILCPTLIDDLGLNKEERKDVFRSVAELAKARLDKAKSV